MGACRRHHFANSRGRVAVSEGMLYELKTNSVKDGAVRAVMRWFVGCVVAHHALLEAVFTTVTPTRHVVVEGAHGQRIIWVAGPIASTCCIG